MSNNSYFICHSNEAKQAVFDEMRHAGGAEVCHFIYFSLFCVVLPFLTLFLFQVRFPEKIGDIDIVGVRDLQIGFDSTTPDHKPLLPSSQSNMMVTFKFGNGAVATIRTRSVHLLSWSSSIVGGFLISNFRLLQWNRAQAQVLH